MSNRPQHPPIDPKELDRRTFLRRAAAAGIALPSMAAILAACGGGAQTAVQTNAASGASGGANAYGTGGIAGAPYPLARPDAPVTWTVQSDNPVIASELEPEKNAQLQVLSWPFYIDPGILKQFEEKYSCKIVDTEFEDMDKGVAKISSGQGEFDIMIGMSLQYLGRTIAQKLIRPINHDYVPNLSANVFEPFQSPFYDQGAQFSVPYAVWTTGIFWRNDKLDIDPASMSNPYDVFFDNPPKDKTHFLANAQDVLSMPMFRAGVTDVNSADAAAISQAKDDIDSIVAQVGSVSYDHVDYNDIPSGKAYLHQSWSGNASDAVVFLSDKSDADNLSYYWPGSDGHPGNVDNDTIVLLSQGKNPVLAHLLANWILDNKYALENFTNMTGYQQPVHAFTPQSMVDSGLVPKHLEDVIVSEEDFAKGSRELELPTDLDTLWQQAFSELQNGV